jgi:hypothetical protein
LPLDPKKTRWKKNPGLTYDHNAVRFLTIFGDKIGVFFKNKCYDLIFVKKLKVKEKIVLRVPHAGKSKSV